MPYFRAEDSGVYFEISESAAPTLVFIHGITCDHSDWVKQVNFFRRTHRVVAIDLRGHGRSARNYAQWDIEGMATDLSGLLKKLGITRSVLVGHSMGCRVALQVSLQTPENLAGVVLVDGSRLGEGDPTIARQTAMSLIATKGYEMFVRDLFADMFIERSDQKEHIIRRAESFPPDVFDSLFVDMVAWDADRIDAALSGLRVPLLVMQSSTISGGKRRPIQAGETSPWLALVRQLVPLAKTERVLGVGHFPMLDAPDEVNRLLEAYLGALQSTVP